VPRCGPPALYASPFCGAPDCGCLSGQACSTRAPCCIRRIPHLGSIAHGGLGSDKAVHASAGRKSCTLVNHVNDARRAAAGNLSITNHMSDAESLAAGVSSGVWNASAAAMLIEPCMLGSYCCMLKFWERESASLPPPLPIDGEAFPLSTRACTPARPSSKPRPCHGT